MFPSLEKRQGSGSQRGFQPLSGKLGAFKPGGPPGPREGAKGGGPTRGENLIKNPGSKGEKNARKEKEPISRR